MARYKMVDRSPRFLPVVLEAQLMPGSFEHALDYLIDHEVDLSAVAKRYVNDEAGAPPHGPGGRVKIVLLARSPGAGSKPGERGACPGERAFYWGPCGRATQVPQASNVYLVI